MVIGSHQKVRTIESEIYIRVNGNEINRVHSVKSLGVHIDEHFTWSVHIDKLCKKIASAIGVLKRIRPFITTNRAVQVYKALIQPHFDYCCSVWDGFGDTLSCKLQKLQNRAARVITRSSYDTSAGTLLDSLCWDNLFIRRKKLTASVMFKALKGKTPSYLFRPVLNPWHRVQFTKLGNEIKFAQATDELPKAKLLLQWGAIVEQSSPRNTKASNVIAI